MNIFVLSEDPTEAARMMCDKHIPKMVVETMQMLGSAVIRHGAQPDDMPLTSKGTPLKGGYHHHPCTRWAGDSRENFLWLCYHGAALAEEYRRRFSGRDHACADSIEHLFGMADLIPDGPLTPFARAMPDDLKHDDTITDVEAYRRYYHRKSFSNGPPSWKKFRKAPAWWNPEETIISHVREVKA